MRSGDVYESWSFRIWVRFDTQCLAHQTCYRNRELLCEPVGNGPEIVVRFHPAFVLIFVSKLPVRRNFQLHGSLVLLASDKRNRVWDVRSLWSVMTGAITRDGFHSDQVADMCRVAGDRIEHDTNGHLLVVVVPSHHVDDRH